jgi:hypothetical protein
VWTTYIEGSREMEAQHAGAAPGAG